MYKNAHLNMLNDCVCFCPLWLFRRSLDILRSQRIKPIETIMPGVKPMKLSRISAFVWMSMEENTIVPKYEFLALEKRVYAAHCNFNVYLCFLYLDQERTHEVAS